ncbi:MAG: 50S ribosomal protein L3 [Patescibacteria group bacterium]|nr:50S ribosomal protein L3 [Patescibacteria group bacterium]
MTKIKAKKLKMSQIYRGDNAVAVTPLEIVSVLEGDASGLGLAVGDLVKVRGISKGKGFQGVVKRHGFAGGPKSHGQKNRWRAPGSIGSTAPQHVFPGRKMAGRTGVERLTVANLEVVSLDEENKIIYLHGAVPGAFGKLVSVQK